MADDEQLLVKNKFEFEGEEKPLKNEVGNYVKQKPNRKTLGVVPLETWLYNRAPKKFDKAFEEYYRVQQSKRTQKLLDSLLIKYELESYVGRSLWFKRLGFNLGKPPVVIDTSLLFKSNEKLQIFYENNGYFDAVVNSTVDTVNKKKGKIVYTINPGTPSYLKTFEYNITDENLRDIFEIHLDKSRIDTGKIFDLDDFKREESRISTLFKNNGYFDFNNSGEELYFDADTIPTPKELDITLHIKKPEGDSTKFNRYFFNNITIYPDSKLNEAGTEYITLQHKNYTFKFKNPPTHRLNYFTDVLTMKPLEMYRLQDEVQTKRNLFQRENFNLGEVRITKDEEESDSLLNANIFLFPKNKYDLVATFEASDSEYLRFGISPSVSLLTRNIFGGGENLEVLIRASLATPGNTDFTANNTIFSAFDLGGQARLNLPYLLLPFGLGNKLHLESANPTTDVRLGYSIQQNIGLDRINYLGGFDYNFANNPAHQHRFSIFNTQIVRNSSAGQYFNVLDRDGVIFETGLSIYEEFRPQVIQQYNNGELNDDQIINIINNDTAFLESLSVENQEDITQFQNMSFRRESLLQNNFINSIIYQYTHDQKFVTGKIHPWFFRGRIELAGNLLAAADRILNFPVEDIRGRQESTILGIPYSQFARVDFDVRKYWNFSGENSLVARNFIGISIPYGNSSIIPIDGSYFAGGSTDIRAWQAYDLGPGSVNSLSNFNVSNFKITWNLEYRFSLAGNLNAALFTDAGNIWSINNGRNIGEFNFDTFLSEIAVGSGFGFRYDFTYLLARIDIGFRIHDPALPEGQRWEFKPLEPRLNLGINYPF